VAGDLERRYAKLAVEAELIVNYGFVPRETLALLHPRSHFKRIWDAETAARAAELLAFIRPRRETRSKDVLAAFSHHGRTTGYWGEDANASTHLLDDLHYRGQLRVLRREAGTRVYAAVAHPEVDQSPAAQRQRAEALLDIIVGLYAPLPAASLGYLASLLGYGAPQLKKPSRRPREGGLHPLRARRGGRPALVLAGRRETALETLSTRHARRRTAPVGPLRPHRLGPPALRIVLGLGLSVRGLHARQQTQDGALRPAPAVG
ncbi:DNA glycosylase AlkZ-like family protein, partial [Roseateles sp. GG27B]